MIKLSPAALDLQALKNTDGSPPRSAVLLELKLSGKTVAGLVLEAAFRTKRGELLLLTTDNTPFEEVLNIQLLDSGLNLLDSAVMGSAYSTGSFKLVRIEYPNGVRFRFIGDTDWTVEVLAASRSAFPGGRMPEAYRVRWASPNGSPSAAIRSRRCSPLSRCTEASQLWSIPAAQVVGCANSDGARAGVLGQSGSGRGGAGVDQDLHVFEIIVLAN